MVLVFNLQELKSDLMVDCIQHSFLTNEQRSWAYYKRDAGNKKNQQSNKIAANNLPLEDEQCSVSFLETFEYRSHHNMQENLAGYENQFRGRATLSDAIRH